MLPIIILQVGTPPEEVRVQYGDLPSWFSRVLGVPSDSIEVVRVFEGEALPQPDPRQIAIITGSWAMVTDHHPWSEASAEWIRAAMAVEMPLFGVCYGHQLMAYALGGQVDFHPLGREVGCLPVSLNANAEQDPLLKDWPTRFSVHLTHEQSVLTLPPSAVNLAASDHDPHQIVRYGPKAMSTQFHPEFTPDIAGACIRRRADALREEGRDPDALLAGLVETEEASNLLRRFVSTVQMTVEMDCSEIADR